MLIHGTSDDAKNAVKSATTIPGITTVLHADDVHYNHLIAENVAELLFVLQQEKQYTHILAPSSNAAKNYLFRLSAKLDVSPLTDITEIFDKNTFLRPTYAGNALAKVRSKDAVKILTVRPTGFEKTGTEGGTASVAVAPSVSCDGKTVFVREEINRSERPDLTSARVVIGGGRGLKSYENFEILYKLADKLKGAVGASRAAVDAGFVPNELQVGQTGKVIAPELYIAVGISGAIQHLAGMKDSKTIVAINKDEEAPIFKVADYGLVGDLFKIVPELTEKL